MIDSTKETIRILKGQGLQIPKSPDYIDEKDKEFPSTELSSLPLNTLLEKLGVFVSLFSYTAYLESIARGELKSLERELKIVEAEEYFKSDEGNVTSKRYARDCSSKIKELQEKYTEVEGRHLMLEALKENYDKYIFALSRTISTLQAEKTYG